MPIYFIRHGESEANERNQFAGREDSPLTRLGIEQAKQAGNAIARKSLVFDEIHVSPLQRARLTAQEIAEVSGNTFARIYVSDALQERHFGFLQGRNKSLWKKVLGYQHYNEIFHSYRGVIYDGETWDEMYQRVRIYYEHVLLPVSQAGRTILVVAHKYIVEMFALIVAGLAPEDYRDFKVPNSYPSSEDDLRYRATHVQQSVNTIGELVEIHLPLLMLSGGVLGVFTKLIMGRSLPYYIFTTGVILCLAVSTFFGLLYADPSRLNGFMSSLKGMRSSLIIRMSLGMALLLFGQGALIPLLGTFFLLPPAMLVPSLALSWGGDYAIALRVTLFLSMLSFLLFGASTVISQRVPFAQITFSNHISPNIHISTIFVYAAVLILPSLAAQWYRLKQPIKAGALSTNWGWIGGTASLPLAFFSTYYYTPVSLVRHMMRPEGGILLGSALILIMGAFAILHYIARLVKVDNLEDEVGRAQHLASTAPNVFLWPILVSPQLHHLSSSWWGLLVMWTFLIFLGGLVIQEHYIVRRVRDKFAPPFHVIGNQLSDWTRISIR